MTEMSEWQRRADGGWRVASKSEPGGWRTVTADGDCDCPGYVGRGRCRHVAMLVQCGELDDPAVWCRMPCDRPVWRAGDGEVQSVLTVASSSEHALKIRSVDFFVVPPPPVLDPHYLHNHHSAMLVPPEWMWKLDLWRANQHYTNYLDKIGYPVIRHELEVASQMHAGATVAIVGTADILTPTLRNGEMWWRWCFRDIFASWYAAHSGIVVGEFAP